MDLMKQTVVRDLELKFAYNRIIMLLDFENILSTHKLNNHNLWVCSSVALSHMQSKLGSAMILGIEGIPNI